MGLRREGSVGSGVKQDRCEEMCCVRRGSWERSRMTIVLMKRARGVCTGSARQGWSTTLRQHRDERCKEGLRGTPGADGRGEYRGAIR